MQPPQGLVEKVQGPREAEVDRRLDAEVGALAAPAQEVVLEGDDVDLDRLPIQRCWPGDPAPFITLPAVITQRPEHGDAQRRHVPDAEARRALDVHALADAQGRAHGLPRDGRAARGRRRARARPRDRLRGERAAPEAHRRVHARGLPARRARRARAGRRRSTSRCRRTPRSSSRATSNRATRRSRGRSATTRATTRRPEPFPVFHLTAMTMRRDAIYPSIVVGKPPAEDAWLGKATERIFLPAIRMSVPEIVDYDLPVAGAFHDCVHRLDPQGLSRPCPEGHARDLGARAAQPDEVGRRRRRARERARLRARSSSASARTSTRSATCSSPKARSTSSTTRRRSSTTAASSASTRRTRAPEEGAREWPEEIEMSDEISELVDRRWTEYGIPARPPTPAMRL